MMPFAPDSYAFIQRTVRQNRGSAALLSDTQLNTLISELPADHILAGTVIGEHLVRCWLYDRCSGPENCTCLPVPHVGFFAKFTEWICSAERHSRLPLEEIKNYTAENRMEEAAQQHIIRRSGFLLECDGIIPLATDYSDDAIAIPFRLTSDCKDADVTDLQGSSLPQWTHDIQSISEALGDCLSLQLLCVTGAIAQHISGSSIGLAVILAYLRKHALIPDHSPLRLIGTGTFSGGALQTVGSIEAKQKLADRLDALLIYPVSDALQPDFPNVGAGVKDIEGCLNRLTAGRGLATRLSPRKALMRLENLESEVHNNQVKPDVAHRLMDRMQTVFTGAPLSPYSKEGQVRISLLAGQMANHAGQPEDAHRIFTETVELAQDARNPSLLNRAATNLIVTLTDLGRLADAERIGKRHLMEVTEKLPGTAQDIERCRMALHGALGQAQRVIALNESNPAGSDAARLSLENLTEAFTVASELEDPAEICRDQTEILLWQALIEPSGVTPVFEATMEILHRYSGKVHTVSEHFALRARWLAAYRIWLTQGTAEADFSGWELPDCRDSAALKWVLGTAQKYRGTLLAARNEMDAAREAFSDAVGLLDVKGQPLLQFISATAALQGGELLEDTDMLQQAYKVFEKEQQLLSGRTAGSEWLARAKLLLDGKSPETNPQLCFQY
jgi:hypothetical protein